MNKGVVICFLSILGGIQTSKLFSGIEFSSLASTLSIGALAKIKNLVPDVNGGLALAGGTIQCTSDKAFLGKGLINGRNQTIRLQGDNLIVDHAISWKNVTTLEICADSVAFAGSKQYPAQWIFEPDETCKKTHLHGNGSLLNVYAPNHAGGMARILVKAGMTLHVSDIKIRGLGAWNGLIELEEGAEIIFSDVELELNSPYVVETGTWQFDGPTTVLTKQWSLLFRNTGKMIITNTTVLDDSLGFSVPSNNHRHRHLRGIDCSTNVIIATDESGKPLGQCHKVARKEDIAPAASQDTFLDQDRTLTSDTVVNEHCKLHVTGGNEVVLNGGGYSLHLSDHADIIVVEPYTTLILEHITLHNFSPYTINGSVIFGRNVKIELATGEVVPLRSTLIIDMSKGNQELPASLVLDGMGTTLNIEELCPAIIIQSEIPESTICFRRLRLFGLGGQEGGEPQQNFVIKNAATRVIFEDATLHMTNDFSYDQGSINFCRTNYIVGTGKAFINNACEYSTILPHSNLCIANGAIYTYRGPSHNGLQLTDYTSFLKFDGATLDVIGSKTGLCFYQGNVIIDNHVVIKSENAPDKGVRFDPKNVTVDVLAAAVIEVQGYFGPLNFQ